ncbi:uncharacterized protein LOC143294788 [Babylonia areolata]|uniref:uncharacterized protein LOC143294788 n=1 Tax=Babylonia areolata TaxID=304850 RepID=UPI003FD57552
MARNEEKQLARLNRYYLEIQKQEELKKRPPRPRLDTLNTPRDLRKWLPTITRDIEFYVKQMEVTCYTDRKIEEFQDRIRQLRGEYRAYLQKLRVLEPELNAASWADRPYTNRKRCATSDTMQEDRDVSREPKATPTTSQGSDGRPLTQCVPIPTPVLQHMPSTPLHPFTLQSPAPVVWNVNPDTEDLPLQFGPASMTLAVCPADHDGAGSSVSDVSHWPQGKRECGRSASSQTPTNTACGNKECEGSGSGKLDSGPEKEDRFALSGSSGDGSGTGHLSSGCEKDDWFASPRCPGVAEHVGSDSKESDSAGTVACTNGLSPGSSTTLPLSPCACTHSSLPDITSVAAEHSRGEVTLGQNRDSVSVTKSDDKKSSTMDSDSVQKLTSVNPLKLDYSDSSDEDV